jgi:hypothetical protein
VNIGTQEDPKILKNGAQCLVKYKQKFMDLFCEFLDVFAWSYAYLHGFDPSVIQHENPIKEEEKLIRQRQRLINPALEATIRKELEKLLNSHIIFPVKYSEWASNLVPVWKIDGDIRLCVDFHPLNRESVKDKFPLPNMEFISQQVLRSQIMSLLDGFLGYNQINVKRVKKYKTIFTTCWRTFAYEHMPFDLINVGATFNRDMQIYFDDMINKIIQIYLDVLAVYFKTLEDHFDHLRQVFIHCKKFGMSLNPTKSIFGVTVGKLLRHILSNSGINIGMERVISIPNLKSPSSKNEIQSFMGKINFIRRFILDFDRMVKPIHNMLEKDQSFSWNDTIENNFVGIKNAIISTLVLENPDFAKYFIIYTNAIE